MLACDRGQDSSPQRHLQLDLPDGRELLGAERRAHGGAGDAIAGYWALREPLPPSHGIRTVRWSLTRWIPSASRSRP